MTEDVPSTKGAWILIAIATALCLYSCTQIYRWSPSDDLEVHNNLVEVTRTTLKQQHIKSKHLSVISSVQVNKPYITRLVMNTFPEHEWANALLIIQCESGFNIYAHGDLNLTHYDALRGEVVGDSVGLFQIRTGGKNWNRAASEGMTADEFRSKLLNPEYNVQYAYNMWKKQGWGPWSCSGSN